MITAVYDPVAEHLTTCLNSVAVQRGTARGQVEHVVVDDGSSDPEVDQALTVAESDRHVVVYRRPTNGGIVAASNDALGLATGEWVVLVDHDDELAPDALARLATAIRAHPRADVVYSDHDLIRVDGQLTNPVYKPDFSLERLRQTNYITHLLAVRRTRLTEIGGFRPGTDGAQDHDVLLRLVERGGHVVHVPRVLSHWRQSPRSVASDTDNKPLAFEAGLRVVRDHLSRVGIEATVSAGAHPGTYRIRRAPRPEATVSVVIPTNGSTGTVWGCRRTFVVEAVRSLAAGSTHRALEIVVVADVTTPSSVFDEISLIVRESGLELTWLEFDEPFNFSKKINVGVASSGGKLLLLLNDDTELIAPGSIDRMASLLADPVDVAHGSVAAVGAKLLYADGTLQHGGHVYHGEFMHAFIGWSGDHPGPQRMLSIERECAGVTAAALMTARAHFESVGGFPEDLPLHFNDVDFCLALRALGHRIIWTPNASWYHFEGSSRDRGATMGEWNRVAGRWADHTPADPYSNPNLTPRRSDWLELPGRSGAPPYLIEDDGAVIWA